MNEGPASDASPTELQRLRAEMAGLEEQVKLLVRTEQRLYRSQNELDAQLQLVRSLARFALDSSMLEDPRATLARALELLGACFPIDWAGFVHPGDEPGVVFVSEALEGAHHDPSRIPVDGSLDGWLRATPDAGWSRRGAGEPEACWRLLSLVAPGLLPGNGGAVDAQMAYVPLRGAGSYATGLMLAVSLHARPAFLSGGELSERHLPYLSLLANHVDRALANTHLTRRLRERSAELAQSLEQLGNTQQELLQSQKMEAIGLLAGGVAHDFNNLLTVILGYSGTLAASLPQRSPWHEHVGKITAASQQAAVLTRHLLALGRRQVQRRERFPLGEQCASTVDLLRRLVGEEIRIELHPGPSPLMIHADRAQLEQVLLNLMVNARDAMPRGGVLRITTRPATAGDATRCEGDVAPERFAVLEVADEGVGMDSAVLERIFEPFFTTKPAGQGTGLGLAVVYGIVKQSAGHILVDSEPGKGTCFRVLLPTEVAPDGADAGEPVRAAASGGGAPVRAGATILVVEDEPAIRDVVRVTLRRAGYDVLEAGDGEDALVRLETRMPDLVLTDVRMPRMGGLALASRLAARHPGVRVAFMSGYAADFGEGPDAREQLSAFLPKPFTGEELRRFVALQLAGARAGHDRP